MRKCLAAIAVLSLMLGVSAQTTRTRFIRTVGEGTASGTPDQAKVDIGVVTQASTAQDAAAQNAQKTAAVLAALKQLLGAGADIRTINYSLNPNYRYDGSTQTLTGFIASNTVQVTLGDLSAVGKVIDTAVQAGATNVQSLLFSIKDDQPLKAQALRLASQQARQHADAMALGLGVRLGSVIQAVEGVQVTPIAVPGAGVAASTPIQPGNIDVQATVTLDIEITQ